MNDYKVMEMNKHSISPLRKSWPHGKIKMCILLLLQYKSTETAQCLQRKHINNSLTLVVCTADITNMAVKMQMMMTILFHEPRHPTAAQISHLTHMYKLVSCIKLTYSGRLISQQMISRSFQETLWPQCSRICSVFKSMNSHFITVLADIYQAGLLTPRSYRSWFTVRRFPPVTHYINVGNLLNKTIVSHNNDKQSTTVNFQETLQISSRSRISRRKKNSSRFPGFLVFWFLVRHCWAANLDKLLTRYTLEPMGCTGEQNTFRTAYHQIWPPLTYVEVKCPSLLRLLGNNSRVK